MQLCSSSSFHGEGFKESRKKEKRGVPIIRAAAEPQHAVDRQVPQGRKHGLALQQFPAPQVPVLRKKGGACFT